MRCALITTIVADTVLRLIYLWSYNVFQLW